MPYSIAIPLIFVSDVKDVEIYHWPEWQADKQSSLARFVNTLAIGKLASGQVEPCCVNSEKLKREINHLIYTCALSKAYKVLCIYKKPVLTLSTLSFILLRTLAASPFLAIF